MHRFISVIGLIATILACATAPVSAAEFAPSSLPAQGEYDPDAYNFAAVNITQNISPVISAGNSVSCNDGPFPRFPHADNRYWRRFDLDGDHDINTCFQASSVDFGVEAAYSPDGSQPVHVRLYTIPNASPLNLANLTLIGSFPLSVANQALKILQAPVTAIVVDPLVLDLVVEVFTPSGQAAGNRFLIGSNSLGQTAPGYLSATACGVTEPADIATEVIGFPNMHIYIAVTGAGCPTPSLAQTWGRLKAIYR